MPTEKSPPIFERSTETSRLVDVMLACPIGDVLTWAEMRRLTNLDIRGGGADYATFHSAREIVSKVHKVEFATITRVGIRRLAPAERTPAGHHRIKRLTRAARRGARLMDVTAEEFATLGREEALAHSNTAGLFAAIATQNQHFLRAAKKPKTGGGNPQPFIYLPEREG